MDFIFDSSLALYLPLYKLDDASFTSKDEHGHLCTVTGAIWTPQGRSFDGTDDQIDCGNAATLAITQEVTCIVWIYQIARSSYPGIIQKYQASPENGYMLSLQASTGRIRVALLPGNTVITASSYVPLNTWTQIGFSWRNGDPVNAFCNGLLVESLANTTNLNSNSSSLKISGTDGGSARFNGIIGEVCIYNRALSPLEFQHNYLATKWRYR